MDSAQVKNSVGIWAFGPNATRFVPGGYHPEVVHEDMVTRTRRVVAGLADIVDGLEYHYPGEINEGTVDAIKAALGPMDIYCLAAGLHPILPTNWESSSIPILHYGARVLRRSSVVWTLPLYWAHISLSGQVRRAITTISSGTMPRRGRC